MGANIASMPQVEYADSIKADLEARAKVEATNIADRQIDIAWLTEGGRIEAKLRAFKSNIGSLNGKTCSEEITAWEDLGKCMTLPLRPQRKHICQTANGKSSISPYMMR